MFDYGVKHGLIRSYDNQLIENLRHIYYGGLPASILLLHGKLSNGHCYDRGTLITLGFGDDDFQVVDADIDSLKLNPAFIRDDPMYADHCIVERTTADGRKLIYDTSCGFVFDKDLYWLMERPKVRHSNSKDSIKRFIEEDEDFHPEDVDRDKYV